MICNAKKQRKEAKEETDKHTDKQRCTEGAKRKCRSSPSIRRKRGHLSPAGLSRQAQEDQKMPVQPVDPKKERPPHSGWDVKASKHTDAQTLFNQSFVDLFDCLFYNHISFFICYQSTNRCFLYTHCRAHVHPLMEKLIFHISPTSTPSEAECTKHRLTTRHRASTFLCT